MPTRRHTLQSGLSAALANLLGQVGATGAKPVRELRLAPFRFDVTVPIGHSLCGGWITPATKIGDPLEALGLVILGAGQPIVLCAVDWTGILNEAHLQWRRALAEGAGTSPDRVTVHTVHQHNAPFACLESQEYLTQHGMEPSIMDTGFFSEVMDRARVAVAGAVKKARPVSAVATAEAPVERVACNRRILGDDGRVRINRGVTCFQSHPELLELDDGLIDPMLKTVAFFDGDEKIAACHYYAVHPISLPHDGLVSAEFPALARRSMQQKEPGCAHIYFTGCAGNINAGKYTDLTFKTTQALADRIAAAMHTAGARLVPQPIRSLSWKTLELLPKGRVSPTLDELEALIRSPRTSDAVRNRSVFRRTWLLRCAQQRPLVLSALHLNGQAALLHLPGEVFVEYQLAAQKMAPDRFVAVAAYGDDGPWYLPTAEAYPQGGYEVSVAFCEPEIDRLLSDSCRNLAKPA